MINAAFIWLWQRAGLRENGSDGAQQECTSAGRTHRLQEFSPAEGTDSLVGKIRAFGDRSIAGILFRWHLLLRRRKSTGEMRGRIVGLEAIAPVPGHAVRSTVSSRWQRFSVNLVLVNGRGHSSQQRKTFASIRVGSVPERTRHPWGQHRCKGQGNSVWSFNSSQPAGVLQYSVLLRKGAISTAYWSVRVRAPQNVSSMGQNKNLAKLFLWSPLRVSDQKALLRGVQDSAGLCNPVSDESHQRWS